MLFRYSHLQIPNRYKTAFLLCGWLVGNWLRSVEILTKSPAVRIEQFADALRFRRTQHEPRVMMLGHAIHNLRVVVCRSVRRFLPRQRDNHAGITVAFLRQRVIFLTHADFKMYAPPTRAATSIK